MQNIFSKDSDLKFEDLYKIEGLERIDKNFKIFFKNHDNGLHEEFLNLQKNKDNFSSKEEANILINCSKVLEFFLIELFAIKNESIKLQENHQKLSLIYKVKRDFIQRKIGKKYSLSDLDINFNLNKPSKNNIDNFEIDFAQKFEKHQNSEVELGKLTNYAIWALFSKEGQNLHQEGALFNLPKKIDPEDLVQYKNINIKERDGFKLTDFGYGLSKVLGEANYCIFCHNQEKDSCSKGLFEKNSQEFKKDFFNQELHGCPLEQKISEMNLLKSQGFNIASLAIAIIDNPMIAATGHRICNDCMKSCIYQKQDPVDIPQIESRVVKDVLNLTYGFEIYSLLTRWNPLNLENSLPKENSGRKVLIAGLGPAGFTLAHYLLNEGHLVVAIDGLKIEPEDKKISGIDSRGVRNNFKPIKNINEIFEELDERIVGGFGGVAEYGITSRWNKNYLKVIRLILERRENFRMFGGVRLGSAFDCKDALNDLNFDHVALCLGAGWPSVLNIKNMFAKGVRSASDFLMSLQLTGAMSKKLITNLQVRLPILVVGAGLTAIDSATESLAYYVLQVEKFAYRYNILLQKIGKTNLEKSWNEEEKKIADEFLLHANLIKQAKENGENITKLLQKLGGAKLIYRKKITEAPSYKTNHLEIQKALEEGVEIIDEATPLEVVIDEFNHIKALKVTKKQGNLIQNEEIAAKSLFIAIGTSPNKAPAYEDKLKFGINNNYFQTIDYNGAIIEHKYSPKATNIGFLAAKDEQSNKMVSFFGDTHKAFSGSVVKAMASAKKGYKVINESLKQLENKLENSGKKANYQDFLGKINEEFSVTVHKIENLSKNFTLLTVKAPILAKKTKIGHIFRLHNYHSLASRKNNITLAMESVAVTIFEIDQKNGLLSTVIVNAGASTSLVKNLKIDEPIIFMGPSGSPTKIAKNQEVAFIAAGRGVFPLLSLAKSHKENGCKVSLFCGFKKFSDISNLKELQEASNNLIIAVEEDFKDSLVNIENKKINFFQGNLTNAFISFAKENKSKINLDYAKIDLIYTMGNEEMMHKIAKIRHKDLKNELKQSHIAITSLNNPMQCMLKGICSQCLQKKINQETGKESYFYSCISQDQKSDEIDFEFLKNRCKQNSLQEKLTKDFIKN